MSNWSSSITNCLIIGGGFIGSHLARQLAGAGDAVAIFSRSFEPSLMRDAQCDCSGITLIEGAVPAGHGLLDLIEAADAVFYLAGASTPVSAVSDPGGSLAAHVLPAAAVMDLMRQTRTRRLVLASSGGTVYGHADRYPTPENHPTRPAGLHGQHSLTIERYANFYAERHGFEAVTLRLANPYGPGQIARRGQGVIAAWTQALAHDEPLMIFGDPHTQRDFVHIDDVVAAIAMAGLEAPPNVYNVGSGEAIQLSQVVHLLAEISNRTPSIVHVGSRDVDVPVTQLDCTRLEETTGWRPVVALREGIAATWRWAAAQPSAVATR